MLSTVQQAVESNWELSTGRDVESCRAVLKGTLHGGHLASCNVQHGCACTCSLPKKVVLYQAATLGMQFVPWQLSTDLTIGLSTPNSSGHFASAIITRSEVAFSTCAALQQSFCSLLTVEHLCLNKFAAKSTALRSARFHAVLGP